MVRINKLVVLATVGPAELAAGRARVHDAELESDEDLSVGMRVEVLDDAAATSRRASPIRSATAGSSRFSPECPEDDEGTNWSTLSGAAYPEIVESGAVVTAGRDRYWS